MLEWCGRIGEMEMELVMAQEQRIQMEEECMQWVDGWKDGINERLSKWSYVSNGRAWKVNELNRGRLSGFRCV